MSKAISEKRRQKDEEEIARIMRGTSKVTTPSSKLHRYGQLLLESQRAAKKNKIELAEKLRKDAEIIFYHFQTVID